MERSHALLEQTKNQIVKPRFRLPRREGVGVEGELELVEKAGEFR